jgi:hypothetical protein
MATNVEMKIGTHFGQMNVGDDTAMQNNSIITFSEGSVCAGMKLFSYFDQNTMAEELFFDWEDKERSKDPSMGDLPETLEEITCDILASMMDEIATHNAMHCNPEKCKGECDICETRPVPKIICIRDKVIRTNGRSLPYSINKCVV